MLKEIQNGQVFGTKKLNFQELLFFQKISMTHLRVKKSHYIYIFQKSSNTTDASTRRHPIKLERMRQLNVL